MTHPDMFHDSVNIAAWKFNSLATTNGLSQGDPLLPSILKMRCIRAVRCLKAGLMTMKRLTVDQ